MKACRNALLNHPMPCLVPSKATGSFSDVPPKFLLDKYNLDNVVHYRAGHTTKPVKTRRVSAI
jgi:hypothetical protein